jgi:hypothetical protein
MLRRIPFAAMGFHPSKRVEALFVMITRLKEPGNIIFEGD